MSDNYNHGDFNDNTASEALKPIKEKGSQKIKQAVGKLIKRGLKALGKFLLMLIKILLPYILIIGIIFLIAFTAYFLVFEFRGTEKEYTQRYENKVVRTEDGKYIALEKDINAQNRIIRDFYLYFSGQSYWQLLGDDNTTLITPDGVKPDGSKIDRIEDYYKREGMFKLNPNLLFSLDEYMYQWKWKYPEQMIKPVYYDPETLTLKSLVDEEGFVIAESDEEDVETGEKTGNKILSVRDYGLGSVLKYNEKDDYKRTIKIKGKYTKKDVWDPATKSVIQVEIDEPFEIEIAPPEDIYLIDKAILFTGEIEYEYEYKDKYLEDLIPGQTEYREEKQPNLEYFYDIHKEPIYEEQINEYGEVEKVIVGYEEYNLYKYRDGAIYENLPVVVNTITEYKGYDYFEDYLYNFESYIPLDAIEDFEFEDRIDYDSYVFDYSGAITDDYGFGLGSALKDKDKKIRFENSAQYWDIINKHSTEFGVDPYIILAIMAQESGGKTKGSQNIEKYGIMQIYGGDRSITAKNAYGDSVTVEITTEEKNDVDKAVRWATAYYKYLLDYFDGDNYKAIQAYNLGEGTLNHIKNEYPESWDSFDWLIHREWARRKKWPTNPSASYGCMEFPEGEIVNDKSPAGDSCYLENVLQYYVGGKIDDVSSVSSGIVAKWDRFKSVLSDFAKKLFIPERDKNEPIPKNDYSYYARSDKVFEILRTTSAMDNVQLFSEADQSYDELQFWEEGFMDSMASIGMSLQDILDIAPNPDGYLPPIILGQNGARITSYYGERFHPIKKTYKFHYGVDIAAPQGTHVYAVADGVVTFSGYKSNGSGNTLIIRHTSEDGKVVESIYRHLHRLAVKEGDIVKQGQMVAEVGNTGVSTGSHLHFEFKINGSWVDPLGIILGK